MPINYINNVPNFGILDTNAVLTTPWSSLNQVEQGFEVKIAIAKSSTNSPGLAVGDMVFSATDPFDLTTGRPSRIGWLSADGTQNNTNWVLIPNEQQLFQAFTIDETGLWGNDLLAVTGDDRPLTTLTNLNIWRVHSRTNIQLVTNISALHLEGALTVPGLSKYGPWAGKFLTADEDQNLIFAVSTNGTVATFSTPSISADVFAIVPTNQDLYCVEFDESNSDQSNLLKLPREFLRRYVGDILVCQGGENAPAHPIIFIVRWNLTLNQFDIVQSLDLLTWLPSSDFIFFEKVAFAPISMPAL